MSTVPNQHPAVVLRSQYTHLRAMLAVALVAVVALAASLVVVALNDDGSGPSAVSGTAAPALSAPAPASLRYDGGPDEGTRGPNAVPAPSTARADGGPTEGTAPIAASPAITTDRPDGGPEEGTRGIR
jgi:hypothetical protein